MGSPIRQASIAKSDAERRTEKQKRKRCHDCNELGFVIEVPDRDVPAICTTPGLFDIDVVSRMNGGAIRRVPKHELARTLVPNYSLHDLREDDPPLFNERCHELFGVKQENLAQLRDRN